MISIPLADTFKVPLAFILTNTLKPNTTKQLILYHGNEYSVTTTSIKEFSTDESSFFLL